MLSPAKINLGLKVLYKRPDNYHEIQSVFLKINWGDEINFLPTKTNTIELVSENELMLQKKDLFEEVSERGDFTKNILYKTYFKAKELNPDLPGVKVHLIKKIPPGGGLGGGSTNAAMLLRFLFQNTPLASSPEFKKIASSIGADIPFFLGDTHSFITGIGEKLQDVEVAGGMGILAIPPFSIPTKESYINLKKPLQEAYGQKEWLLVNGASQQSLKEGNWEALKDKFENDFEVYAFKVHPELGDLKRDLYESGCSFASMTGSGSCVYGFVKELRLLEEVKEQMTSAYPGYYFVSFKF